MTFSTPKPKPKKKAGPLSKEANSLVNWGKAKWGTRSGNNSIVGAKATGERYLPKAKLDSLTPTQYAATTKKKRKGSKQGKQHVRNTKAATVRSA